MRTDFGVDQADGLRRLLVRAQHGEAEPSGAGVPASHLLPQSAGRNPHLNPLPEGEEAIVLSPSGGKLDRGQAITSDLASVVCSPDQMASSTISNLSEVCNQTRVITLTAGKAGAGRTSVTINLAAALARSGKDVLVLDENDTPNNVLDRLGMHARHDLLDVVQGKCRLGQAVLEAGGFSVLPAARAMHALAVSGMHREGSSERGVKPGRFSDGNGFARLTKSFAGATLDQAGQQRLEGALAELAGGVDVILVDAAAQSGSVLPAASGTAILVVVEATASGITESYALIKRLALEYARLQFEIVVNRVAGEPAAMMVFDNMAKLARRNFAARLEYLGCIPQDDRLGRAAQLGKPVVEAFPNAASAQSYVGLARKLLLMPMCQDNAADAGRSVMRDLLKPASQLHQRLSRETEPVVN